ncbi:MAG: N-acetylmuramoyl-L-alanine amidase [Thermoanaerobaculia bacterium]
MRWLVALVIMAAPGCATVQSAEQPGLPDPQPAAGTAGSSRTTALMTEEGELFLRAEPVQGEGLLRFAARFTGSPQNADDIAAANDGARELEVGQVYRLPFDLLLPEYQVAVLKALFPGDQALAGGWEHEVTSQAATGGETLWQVAEWFTDDGRNYKVIRAQNELVDEEIRPGQRLLVPAAALRPSLRSILPAAEEEELLTYRTTDGEELAIYQLRGGEALYSAVVVRFTGRMFAEDVNALAMELARGSGIADVTDIPIGYPIKIPVEHLLPEFLPPDDPQRREYEQTLSAASRFTNTVRAQSLVGVTVVLDAGHGGRDVGAVNAEVWESLYVYDVMLRTTRLLEALTSATVVTTTRDGDSERIAVVDILPASHGHAVLTDPPYPIEDANVGVNLRWYLANSHYRDLLARGIDRDKIVFISIHADSLHPSLRGGMVYVPGASGRRSSASRSGAVYAARREVREHPVATFSQQDSVRSEGLSRELAAKLLQGYERTGLVIHAYKPIRDRIVRSRSWSYVPAVLRYNEIPASVLLEVCNLNNTEDRELLQTQKYRQQVAEAIVHGILDYYGFPVSPELLAAGSVTALSR